MYGNYQNARGPRFLQKFQQNPPPTMVVIEILNDRLEQHIFAAPANAPQFSLLHTMESCNFYGNMRHFAVRVSNLTRHHFCVLLL
jgi:hypothetical protein